MPNQSSTPGRVAREESTSGRRAASQARLPRWRTWAALIAAALLAVSTTACYNNNTGETNVGGAINFKLPAFPESGANAVQVFTEMHYQPSYRAQEGPRLLPPPDSVPVTGREARYTSLDEYKALKVPESARRTYDPIGAQTLFAVNCVVCHGTSLRGDGPIVPFIDSGPAPANLTASATTGAADGELFGFISGGGRQGLASILRGRESASPMPEFRRLLTEEQRWHLVLYLRALIGGP